MIPKISFCIPTYNRMAWIAECIESLRKQTINEIEIIVVDDCSTDKTEEIVKYLASIDHRITYYKNPKNVGAGMSRNMANKLAQADIICVCDSDDYYPQGRAEKTLEYFKKNPYIDIVNSSYYRVGYSNEIVDTFYSEPFNKDDFRAGRGVYFCHPSCAYRRDDILELPYKPETKDKTDDYQLITDWVENNKRFGVMDDVLCFHRVLPNSMMYKMRGETLA